MANGFGVSFVPGAQDPAQQQQNGARGGAPRNPVQEAIQILSLRLPKVFGARALAPAPLLNAPGAMGQRGGASAQALAQMAGLPAGAAMPSMPAPMGLPPFLPQPGTITPSPPSPPMPGQPGPGPGAGGGFGADQRGFDDWIRNERNLPGGRWAGFGVGQPPPPPVAVEAPGAFSPGPPRITPGDIGGGPPRVTPGLETGGGPGAAPLPQPPPSWQSPVQDLPQPPAQPDIQAIADALFRRKPEDEYGGDYGGGGYTQDF